MEFPPECHRVFGYVDFRVWGAEDQSQPKTLLTMVEAWEKTQNTRRYQEGVSGIIQIWSITHIYFSTTFIGT